MGKNMVLHLLEQGIDVVAYNRTQQATDQLKAENLPARPGRAKLTVAYTTQDFVKLLPSPRVIWLMVAAGAPVDEVLDSLIASGIEKDDIVIDGGNSFYKDTIRRYDKLSKSGIKYIDCGTSGGLEGGRTGACLMLGGDEAVVKQLEWLWNALSTGPASFALRSQTIRHSGKPKARPESDPGWDQDDGQTRMTDNPPVGGSLPAQRDQSGWAYFGTAGAGHFVKMVHNGVEYGMDQAIGEGFALLAKGPYTLDLASVAKNWNHGSIVRGWLMELLARAFSKDPHLDTFTGKVGGGETGAWVLTTARELGIEATALEIALVARKKSVETPTFATKVISALRREYGGHEEAKP